MQEMTSLEAVAQLRGEGKQHPGLLGLVAKRMVTVKAAFAEAGWEWDPDEHGAFWLVEAGDDVRDLREAGLNPEDRGLLGAVWEVCEWHPEVAAWEVFILASNDGGPSFFVPDAPWLDPELRAKLVSEATPSPEGVAG